MASPEKKSIAPVVQPVPKDEVAPLKAGEYLVHVYIEETRGLRNPKAADSTVDPIVEVKAFGKSRFSKVQKDVGSGATFWGEHFFFEKNFNTTFELENERVVISMLDHSTFGVDGLIGTVELNIPAVYQKDKHCLQYQWAALSGLTKSFHDVLGFVKFSVGVFAPDDEQVPLNEERGGSAPSGPNQLNVLYPPQITTTPYQIHIKVFRGEKLKKMDTFGKTDPYVQIIYAGMEVKSTILKVTLDPVWNEELLLPTSLPTINNRLIFKLFDWESGPVQADEHMGTVYFNVPDILAGKFKKPFWVNVYGSHSDVDAKNEKIQNDIPELGTEWKGRVEIAINMEEVDRPIVQCRPLKDAQIIKLAEAIKREVYELRVEVHYALNLPTENEDYTIRIRWGPVEATTKKKTSKHRLIEFYESVLLTAEFPINNSADLELPDVFIYLNNGKKDISYMRKTWQYFQTPGVKAKTHHFKVDKGLSSTRSDLAGLLKIRGLISKPSEKASIGLYGWDKPVQKRQAQTPWKIHFNVFQAKDLISGDATGLSDAFLSAYFYGAELNTSVIDQSLNPIWNERLEFGGTFEDVDDAPPLMITLWDKDLTSNDFIGNTEIHIKQTDLNPTTLPKPTWFALKYGKDGGHAGRVLASLCCYNRQDIIPRSPYIAPDTVKYYINMKILGLRQLESTGIIPVKRAFIRFDVNSLRTKTDRAQLPEKMFLKTEPLEPGPNPNILTVINLNLELPMDPEYSPSLSGAVFDYILKGLSQPLLGNFSIPLGDHIKKTSIELEKRIEMLSKIYYATMEKEEAKKSMSPSKPKAIESFNIEVPAQRKSESKKGDYIEIEMKKEESKADESMPLDTEGDNQPLIEKKTSFIQNLIKKKSSISREKEVKIDLSRKSSQRSSVQEQDPTAEISEEAKASQKFVVQSRFNREGEELDKPDLSKYMELGHNNKERTSRKHYRYFINGELEHTEYMDASPFSEIPIFRGRQVTEESFIGNIFEKSEHYRCVGYLKTMVNIMNEYDKMKYDAKIAHVGHFAQTKGLEFSDDEFLRKRDVMVRLYIIEAEGLPDKDDDSNSDPYLIVKLGGIEYNEQEFYQENNPNPKFYKCYEFPTSLPGASKLTIQAWDHDHLDRDDLIGTTTIDIEDRWYSTKWRSLKYVPVETRKLYHPSSKLPQGTVKLWLEILPKDLPQAPIWNIVPKPTAEFELRVVVWECKDVPNVDIEDAVDIYITGKLPDGQQGRTDTHFRSQNGKGNFNWRMVFPITLPMKKHRINFQIWDKDLLSANDYISEASLDFDAEALKAFEKEELVNINGPNGKEQKFWIPCTNSKVVNGKSQQESLGSILVSMALVPKAQALLTPVGKGRETPNQNPYLPPPDGRFEWTWSISKLYQQLIGPLARKKIIMWISIGLCIFILILTLPMIIAEGVSRIFSSSGSAAS